VNYILDSEWSSSHLRQFHLICVDFRFFILSLHSNKKTIWHCQSRTDTHTETEKGVSMQTCTKTQLCSTPYHRQVVRLPRIHVFTQVLAQKHRVEGGDQVIHALHIPTLRVPVRHTGAKLRTGIEICVCCGSCCMLLYHCDPMYPVS